MIAIRPRADQVATPGERLVIDRRDPDCPIQLIEETVLPERVSLEGAQRVKTNEHITLDHMDAAWLHAVLGVLLCHSEAEPSLVDVPPGHLLAMYRDITALIEHERHVVVHQALLTRRSEIERALAIHNARSARAFDRQDNNAK